MFRLAFVGLVVFLMCGCSGRYIGQPREAVLAYQTTPTYGTLYTLASAYADNINAAVAADTLHPGMYADYGVALALMGHNEEACRMLGVEVKAFPQSLGMVRRIAQNVLPDCNVESAGMYMHDTADRKRLASWAYDSVKALQPLTIRIASVVDSTDPDRLAQQTPVDSIERPIRLTAKQKRIMLEQEQAREAQLKQAAIDSVNAAKQAKIKARKQAQIDKKKAKKEKERAKKAEQKAKKQAAAEKKKQKELQRKQAKKAAKGGSK